MSEPSNTYYSMDELLTQREHAGQALYRAKVGGVRAEIEHWEKQLAAVEVEIGIKADEMADDVQEVLDQPDERPYDWEVDGDGN